MPSIWQSREYEARSNGESIKHHEIPFRVLLQTQHILASSIHINHSDVRFVGSSQKYLIGKA